MILGLPKPATRNCPSGEKARALTGPLYSVTVTINSGRSVAPVNRPSSFPDSISQSNTCDTLSSKPYPTASRRLSEGENATLVTFPLSPVVSCRTALPVAASHRPRLLLFRAHAMSWPSGENWTLVALPLAICSRGRTAVPALSRSQIRTVLSVPLLTSCFPSLENSIDWISP